jgi:RES domain
MATSDSVTLTIATQDLPSEFKPEVESVLQGLVPLVTSRVKARHRERLEQLVDVLTQDVRIREVDVRHAQMRALSLVDLSTKGLERIGLQRRDIIDTPVEEYERCREWAIPLHTRTPAQGLLWISRQDDSAQALVVFGDRVVESAFKVEIDRERIYEGENLDILLALAEHVGITQVIGL